MGTSGSIGDAHRRTIRFYFDYVSPNAYLAWTQLPHLGARHGVAVEAVPVLFAGLLDAHGQLGPAEVRPKLRWMSRNNLRKAALLRVPLNPPAFHPFNPLLALRVTSLPTADARKDALIGALFDAVWVDGLHVSDAAVVAAVADRVGLDGADLVERAGQPDAKARVKTQTDDAIARGVFGVPTMEIGSELFWGYDDFAHLELHLAGNDPLDAAAWETWAVAPGPSAVRRRSKRGRNS
jgi:2-hydroxychromene-2-carboxylate isomerase